MAFKHYLNEPYLQGNEKKYINDVIDKGWLSINGEYTKKFENMFANFIDVNHCLALHSGTAALHTALLALGIGKEDKVVIPNYTCSGCATSVIQTGAEPIIIDVDKETFGLDAEKFQDAINEYGDKVKAVMPIHIYGFVPRDFKKIIEIAKKNNIKILEDTCEAHGATFEEKKLGSFGDISAFSIRSEKMIGVGEGGLVITDNKELYDKAYFYAARACDFNNEKNEWWERYYYKGVGMNYRLPHLLGAIAVAQMENFEKILQMKINVGKKYIELLKNNNEIILQKKIDNSSPVYWLNAIILKNKTKEEIREIGKKLINEGIEIRPAFWPLTDMEFLKQYKFGTQENTNYLFEKMIILPSSVNLVKNNFKGVKEIVQKVKELI